IAVAEAIVQAAARHGDRELFDRLRAAVASTQDRRERRILYLALGSFGDQGIARSALALILDPVHDYREAIQIAWSLTETPRGSVLAYAFVKVNFDSLVSMAPLDAAAYYPRMAGNFCSEEQRADVEAFFRERAPRFAGGPRILAQTLERIHLCAAFKHKQQASLAAFLEKY
ncbi:MAG: ERAP1-like C-terminal domain-containing protein, partial [Burkholderiales bacterium]